MRRCPRGIRCSSATSVSAASTRFNDPAFFQIAGPWRQASVSRRKQFHQLDAQMGFQRRNLPRHHRARHAELLGGGGKTAPFRHSHKQTHRLKPVHCCHISNKDLLIVYYFAPVGKAKLRLSDFGEPAMTSAQPALFVPHGAPTFALRPGVAGAGACRRRPDFAATPRHRNHQRALWIP